MLVSGLKVLEVSGCVLCFSVGSFFWEVGSVCLFGLGFFVRLGGDVGCVWLGFVFFFNLMKKAFLCTPPFYKLRNFQFNLLKLCSLL